MRLPKTPPASRAPTVLASRPALERELADLRLQVAERALAAYEGGSEERARLAALMTTIETLEFQVAANSLAHDLAKRLDREAVAEWRRQIEASPDEATRGITRKACCRLCTEAHGCIISGGSCAHPITAGGVGPRLQGNDAVRALFNAAAAHFRPCNKQEDDAA
jgi:hypothetical protein